MTSAIPQSSIHSRSSRRALYQSAPARCVAVSGQSELESRELIDFLVARSTREESLHRNSGPPGDFRCLGQPVCHARRP